MTAHQLDGSPFAGGKGLIGASANVDGPNERLLPPGHLIDSCAKGRERRPPNGIAFVILAPKGYSANTSPQRLLANWANNDAGRACSPSLRWKLRLRRSWPRSARLHYHLAAMISTGGAEQ
jgi:hypothetical protein